MDIQDLLNEVEEVIQDRPSKSKQTGYGDLPSSRSSGYTSSRGDDSYRGVSSTSSTSSRTKSSDNIDDLLSMLEGGDDSPRTGAVHPRQGPHSSVSYTTTPSTKAEEFHVASGSKKCSTAMLGGESAKRGANTAFLSHNVCANLRCNECDFTVVQFVGKKWSSNADYMFFRENVPNETKLRARMEVTPGSAAYACQCKWLSIDVQTRVDMCRVKWSCAGH